MELIAKISKGTKMDQIYIPKNRPGLSAGDYVIIKSLEVQKPAENPYLYNIKSIEPIKLEIVNEIFGIIDKSLDYANIIITGSFIEQSFKFNDIDILIITEENNPKLDGIKAKIKERIGIAPHIIAVNNRGLIKGLETDPLYQMMLSRCISKKRIIYSYKSKINYKILDLHLLKSKSLLENFDILRGGEKYYLTRNMIAILLYLNNTKVNKREVDNEIKKIFNLDDIDEIKENLLDKNKFIKKYRLVYNQLFKRTLEGINNESKQKKHN